MKTTIFLFCVLFAAAAVGQTGGTVLSSEPQRFQIYGHPEHASQIGLAMEQRVLESNSYTAAQGERPLWEVAPKVEVKPLGDTARQIRREHASVKKAVIVWEN